MHLVVSRNAFSGFTKWSWAFAKLGHIKLVYFSYFICHRVPLGAIHTELIKAAGDDGSILL